MAETLGDAVLILRTDDRGLNSGVDQAEAKSRGLGRTLDATSGSATKLGRAIGDAGNSAGAAAPKTQAYSADIQRLKAQVDPAWAALMKFKDGAALARQALQEGAITSKQYVEYMRASANAAGLLTNAQGKLTQMTGAQRAGMQQLGMQFNDMATMYALGARPAQIFASQIGQITQALQLMSGGTSRVAAFLGGPWGIALSTAAVVLVPFIAKLFESEDAATKSSKANETWADKLDVTKHSLNEVTAAMRDYIAESKKANGITLQSVALEAKRANGALQEALALRQKLAARLEEAKQAADNPADPEAVTGANIVAANLERQIASNNAAIKTLEKGYQDAVGNVAGALAKLDTDPTVRIKTGFDALRQRAKDTITDVEKLRQRLAELNRAEEAELKKAQADKRTSTGTGSTSAAANVGDMTALLKTLFPGARITATTGGKHVKGSDHYAARAIDFVPAGGMGQYSTAEVEKMLEDAGVMIRRNAGGTKQIFGPGRSASKPGDHDDHFHFAWTGSGSPEEAARKAEQAANAAQRKREQEERRQEGYNRDLGGLMQEAANLRRQMADTIEERYQLERQALETSIDEQKRRITASNDYTEAEKATLLARLEIKAGLERELLNRRRKEEIDRQALEVAEAIQSNEAELLQKQLNLTGTREKRREIEQQLLDIAYQQRRAALEAIKPNDQRYAAAQVDLRKLDEHKAADQRQLDRDYQSPIQRYMRELQGLDTSINDQMENVAVKGLQTLEDKLLDVIMNAKSLGSAFKEVAKSIIADLIRIGIQRQIIAPLLGMVFGGGAASGGSSGVVVTGSDGAGLLNSAWSAAFPGLFGGGSSAPSSFMDTNPDRTLAEAMAEMFGSTGLFGFGGKSGGGLFGSIFGSMFGGFHAAGGLIPTGTFGIVGEHGPEPVISTGQGALVRPNSALSQMGGTGGGRPGTLKVEVVGARGNREIEEMVQSGVASGLAAYDGIVGDRVQEHIARRG
jgi:hypothetical protein